MTYFLYFPPFVQHPMSTDTLHFVPDLSFNVFLFQRFSLSLIALSTQDVLFFQSNPISTLFTPFFPPSSHCCIYWRFFFLVDINEWNLLHKVWIEITFESKQSWVFYVSIVQLHLPGEDYRRRLRQCELSFGGNNSYSLTITFIW